MNTRQMASLRHMLQLEFSKEKADIEKTMDHELSYQAWLELRVLRSMVKPPIEAEAVKKSINAQIKPFQG